MTITTMTNLRILINILLFAGLTLPAFSQEQPLKDYAEDRRERKFCLYPSTLRMLNMTQNEGFNEMVSGIEKLLIYNLDSAARADRSYTEVFKTYQELGYEEYMAMYGGGRTMYLYGNENKKPYEFIGVFGDDDMALAIYLRGMVNWGKIPELIKTIQEGDVLNIFDLNSNNFENHSQDH